jgi:hypothetical protein
MSPSGGPFLVNNYMIIEIQLLAIFILRIILNMAKNLSIFSINNKTNWSFPFNLHTYSLSYFIDLLQLELHPLTHATISRFVAFSNTNTKKPKHKSSSKLSTMDHFQTLKHQKKNKNFEFR